MPGSHPKRENVTVHSLNEDTVNTGRVVITNICADTMISQYVKMAQWSHIYLMVKVDVTLPSVIDL